MGRTAEQWLEKYVIPEPNSGCWLWLGSYCKKKGYGRVTVSSSGEEWSTSSHRLAYHVLVGPVPDGLQLDHLCRNTACCNPDHLEPVTGRVNVLRSQGVAAQNFRKTHCPKGHEYTPDNIRPSQKAGRSCRACERERRLAKRSSCPHAHVTGDPGDGVCHDCGVGGL